MATPRKLDFPDVTDPNFDPDVPFEADNGINYTWNGNAWEVVCGAGTETDGFLLKHGHIVDDAPGIVEYEWNQDVKVTIKDDNFWTFRNSADYVQLEGLDDDNISLNAELSNVAIHSSSVGVIAEYLFSLESKNRDITLTAATDHAERVNRTIDASSPDEQITNKRYVDETAAFLQSEIVELEEEIEGIAITSERGEWISATSVNPGEFRMVNLLGSNTQDYGDETIVSIFFNNNDANDPSVEHGWADVEVGNILELLDKPDSDYAIFEITAKNPGTGVMAFDVAYVKGVGEATLGDRTRIKIFAKPTGGNLEDYVRIAGDDMTGRLRMDTGTAGFDTDYRKPTDGNTAFIQLKHLANTSTKLASIWQPRATEEIALGRSVHIESILYCNAWYGYVLSDAADGSGRRERTTQDPNIQFLSFNGDDRGRLKWGSDDRLNWTEAGGSLFSDNNQVKLSWSSDRVEILKPVAHNVNATGFKIRGTRPLLPGGSDVFDNNGDIFRVKHVNNEADFIEYLGQIKDSACLVNKGYVDDAISNATGSALVDVRTNNPSNPDIGHMWYNKSTNQLLLRIS
jgi:hypothetical protein